MADALTRLKTRLGDEAAAADPALLETLLDDAQETILGYTNRARMPTALVGAQVELALIAYNQTGVRGQPQRGRRIPQLDGADAADAGSAEPLQAGEGRREGL